MNKIKYLKKLYDRLEEVIVITMVGATTLLIFYQVVMRYVWNNSPVWSEEIARFMFIWESWLGISLAQKYSKHIKIEVLTNKLTGKKLYAVNLLGDLLTALICIVLLKYGFQVMDMIFTTSQTSSATHMPMWIVYLACPLSCGLMICRLLGDMRKQAAGLRGREVA